MSRAIHMRIGRKQNIVRIIRASNDDAPTLASRFNVSRAAIHFVRKGVTWKHVV